MIRPSDLLRATEGAVRMFGEDCTDAESGIDIAWAVMAFLPLPNVEQWDTFGKLTLMELSNEALFWALGATAMAAQLHEEMSEFAREGFTYGEIYDAMAERILPLMEPSA